MRLWMVPSSERHIQVIPTTDCYCRTTALALLLLTPPPVTYGPGPSPWSALDVTRAGSGELSLRQWDGYTIVLQALVTVYRIRAAPCRPFRFPSSTVPAHTGTRSAAGNSAQCSENDHGVSSVRVVVESSLWSISSSDLLLYFTRRSLGSGGLSVWAYAPITSDIMPFEAGDPEAPSKRKNISSESPRGPVPWVPPSYLCSREFHVWEMNRDTSSSKTHTRKRRYGQISAFSQ
ncbi:hypothetical protein CTAM01_02432 [Colletotrichum tamarilloi]|uniref:Uncharacterized protein n=1 Tax=Colletotrichum tamarilloi TaxID=1209934 RepID=A0ABQ9RNR8_9PEZI|nr:uncharacterized protein CTAM01_02432 [Colletotrichum tamarilloi]KAK1508646.1 hypothetical protein CTAM01_02432 [Colletotrichum tamarilloi]